MQMCAFHWTFLRIWDRRATLGREKSRTGRENRAFLPGDLPFQAGEIVVIRRHQ
jgi:hypothetical protein